MVVGWLQMEEVSPILSDFFRLALHTFQNKILTPILKTKTANGCCVTWCHKALHSSHERCRALTAKVSGRVVAESLYYQNDFEAVILR